MPIRFVRPETTRIPISGEAWIVVKNRLTARERRTMLTRLYPLGPDGEPRRNFDQIGFAELAAYLVDWSTTEFPIRGVSSADLDAAIDSLEDEDRLEILVAIEGHVVRLEAAREAEKKTRITAPASSPISRSLVGVAGGTNG